MQFFHKLGNIINVQISGNTKQYQEFFYTKKAGGGFLDKLISVIANEGVCTTDFNGFLDAGNIIYCKNDHPAFDYVQSFDIKSQNTANKATKLFLHGETRYSLPKSDNYKSLKIGDDLLKKLRLVETQYRKGKFVK